MWAQIKHLQSNAWTERLIRRPYLAFESALQDALQHTLPNIIPPSHHEDALYPLPVVVFRMFDYTDVPDVSFSVSIHFRRFRDQLWNLSSLYYFQTLFDSLLFTIIISKISRKCEIFSSNVWNDIFPGDYCTSWITFYWEIYYWWTATFNSPPESVWKKRLVGWH